MKRGLRRWMAPERVPTPFVLWLVKSRILRERYGVALVLSPWNYPLQLALAPLAGALAAGNCAVANRRSSLRRRPVPSRSSLGKRSIGSSSPR